MASSDRDQRLAAKLRENLRRRKAQAKARADTGPGEAHEGANETISTDTSEKPKADPDGPE